MTTREPRDGIRTDQPRQPSPSSPAQIQSHTSTAPKSFDEGSVFTRAALQTTQLLELPAEVRNRLMADVGDKPAEANPYRGNTALLDASTVAHALQQQPSVGPVEPAREAAFGIDPTATLYDGGALREHALKLAQELASAAAGQTTPGGDDSDLEHPLPAPVPTPDARVSGLGAVASAWRRASLVRRVTALLLPVAALATLWPDDDAEARSAASSAGRASQAARATEPGASASPALSPPDPAQPSNVPTQASSSGAIEASATQRFLEAQALKAAFSGDTLAAARHYERLAREQKDPRFELAVRLVKSEAMRRP
jgi:hypothetical protein